MNGKPFVVREKYGDQGKFALNHREEWKAYALVESGFQAVSKWVRS